jgi:thiol-disulfide isomerase/thioredoxin
MKNLAIIILVLLCGCSDDYLRDKDGNILNKTYEDVYPKVVTSFDSAEKEFVKKEATEVTGKMDPDAKKCVCKGNGKIVHGDGHVTDCIYHGKKSSDSELIKALEKEVDEYLEKNKELINVIEDEIQKPEPQKVSQFPQYKHYNNSSQKVERQIVVFSASWCAPCRIFKDNILSQLPNYGLVVSDKIDADFRIVDIDQQRQYFDTTRGRNNMIPFIAEFRNNVLVRTQVVDSKTTLEYLLQTYAEKK